VGTIHRSCKSIIGGLIDQSEDLAPLIIFIDVYLRSAPSLYKVYSENRSKDFFGHESRFRIVRDDNSWPHEESFRIIHCDQQNPVGKVTFPASNNLISISLRNLKILGNLIKGSLMTTISETD